MARSKKKARKIHDGPHWGVMSVPGYRQDGNDTTWYLVYGRTQRREKVGQGAKAMQKALRETERRNKEARDRMS